MKNREYLKKYLLESLIVIVVFIGLFLITNLIEYNKYKQNFNYKISAIISEIQDKYPSISKDSLVDILNSSEKSDNVLKEYGYDILKDSYILQNDKENCIFMLFELSIISASFILLMILFIKYSLKNDQEIAKIIDLIEQINHKNYELKIDEISEDKLSILKEEIYKTTIMLKENAENSLKDKINLKNYLQDISHQLKTPLTSINILLDNLSDEPDMDLKVRKNFLKQIKREIGKITFLVQTILKLSSFETNTIKFIRKAIPVIDLINEVTNNVSNLCDLRNIQIEIVNNIDTKINCDFKWQVEALTNILKNAIDYSLDGSKVLIICEDCNIYTAIKIKDFGKGLAEEDILNIFKRFYKGKNATSDSIGIGLSLAKAIIEEDNGQISAQSTKDLGTTFTIKYYK